MQEHPSPPRVWGCGVLPWVITAITEVQQLAVTARWGSRRLCSSFSEIMWAEEDPGYNSQADDDSTTWSSHLLTNSSVLPGMISEGWPCMCVCVCPSVAYNLISACSIIYISASGLISPQSVCLANVVSQWETRPEASITGERGNRADQAMLSIRQAGLSRHADCVLHFKEK